MRAERLGAARQQARCGRSPRPASASCSTRPTPTCPTPSRSPRRGSTAHAAGPGALPNLLGLPGDGKIQVVDTAQGRVVQTRTPGPGPAGRGRRQPDPHGHRRGPRRHLLLQRRRPRPAQRPAGVAARRAQPAYRGQRLVLQAGAGPGRRLRRGARRRPARPAGADRGARRPDPVARREGAERARRRRRVRADPHRGQARRWPPGRSAGARRPGGGRSTPEAQAAITPYAAIIADARSRAKIVALNPRTGAVLAEARTDAKVFAVGPAGLILVSGRDMAYVPFAAG